MNALPEVIMNWMDDISTVRNCSLNWILQLKSVKTYDKFNVNVSLCFNFVLDAGQTGAGFIVSNREYVESVGKKSTKTVMA